MDHIHDPKTENTHNLLIIGIIHHELFEKALYQKIVL